MIRSIGDPNVRFEEDPVGALAEMHAGLAATGDEDRIFALAELSFIYGQQENRQDHYLAAASGADPTLAALLSAAP